MGAINKTIVFTVTNDLTYDQRMQRICRSLCQAGYRVQLWGRVLPNSAPLTTEPYEQKRWRCFFNKGKLFYAEHNLRLLLALLFTRYDAVCAVDLDTIAPAVMAGKLKGAKVVYDAHEYFTEVPEVIRRPAVKKAWQWVARTFIPKVDLAYTVSAGLAEIFAAEYHKPFELIRNVPYRKTAPAKTAAAEKYILYQGALNEGRGLEFLLEAMPHLNCRLLLAGEGDLSEQLRAQAKQLNLGNKVTFLGFVKPDELRSITEQAYLGIHTPENKGLSYYYSLANKFFNYAQAGVPQVCVSFPEYEKLNNEYKVAILLHTLTPHEIKQAIERLLSDGELYAQLQANCQRMAAELNWENEEVKLRQLYNGLLG